MFKFIKQSVIALFSFTGSLARVNEVSDHAKYVSLSNEPCIARSTLIDLNLKERYCYPLMVSLDRYDKIFNTLNDSSSRISVPNKAEDVNLNVIKKPSKTLHVVVNVKLVVKINNKDKDKCQSESKNPITKLCMQNRSSLES